MPEKIMKPSIMLRTSIGPLATCSFGPDAFAFERETLGPSLAITFLILVASFSSATAYAAEPSGHITITRDVPVHGAFRPGDVGRPTDIATAREDIVLTNTNAIARSPQSMSDAALGNVAAQTASRPEAEKRLGETIATLGMPASGSVVGQGLTSTTGPSQAIGAVIPRSTSPIGAAVSGLAVLK